MIAKRSVKIALKAIEEIGKEIPVTYVPARNTIFLSVALGYAEVLGAFDIFLGVNAVDYSGYPDCRPEFIEAFEQTANLATAAAVKGEGEFTIHAPLIRNTVSHGKPVIVIGRGSHKASVLSPVSGVVSAINLSVKENAAIAGEDPYAHGWILKVHTENLRHDLKNLLIGSEAVKQLEQEIERLLREIEMITGASTITDTDISNVIPSHLPDIGWKRLVRLFL